MASEVRLGKMRLVLALALNRPVLPRFEVLTPQ
jgi:hypothetical protein